MNVTTFAGIVENGQIRLPADLQLPEKTTVYVVVPPSVAPAASYVGSPRLLHSEQALDFVKKVIEENPDAGL